MNEVVVSCIAVATLSTYIRDFAKSKDGTNGVTIKPLIGGFAAAIFLSLVATWSDQVANAFAALILLSALLVNGAEIAAILNKKVAK